MFVCFLYFSDAFIFGGSSNNNTIFIRDAFCVDKRAKNEIGGNNLLVRKRKMGKIVQEKGGERQRLDRGCYKNKPIFSKTWNSKF